jgi:hypothetical protein
MGNKVQKPERADLLSIFKRGSTSVDPHELTLITDKRDPMYDARVHLDVPDEDILNLAAVGFVQPVAVRLRGDDAVIVDGVQRVKRSLIINAVTGTRAYTGNVQAVKEAIMRLSRSDSAVGRRIIDLCPKGVKVPISVHRGKEADAFAAKVSANEFRQGDPIIEKARKAQQLNNHGHDAADIAAMFRVSAATVKRWLAMDTEKERGPKKKRAKSTRPTPARIQKTLGAVDMKEWSDEQRVLVQWLLGKGTDADLFAEFPFLKPAEAEAA